MTEVTDSQGSSRLASAPPHILVAEDDEMLAVVVQSKLSRAGFRAHVERDGKAAWSAIQAQMPSLVVLDWMMPEMDGLSLLALIRGTPQTQGIPVIMLTAVSQREDVQKALMKGANDYLVKPFVPEDLVKRIHRFLPRRAAT